MASDWKPIGNLSLEARVGDLIEIRADSAVQFCVSINGEDDITGYYLGIEEDGILLTNNRRGTLMVEDNNVYRVDKDLLHDYDKFRILDKYKPSPGNGLDEVFCHYTGIEMPDEDDD